MTKGKHLSPGLCTSRWSLEQVQTCRQCPQRSSPAASSSPQRKQARPSTDSVGGGVPLHPAGTPHRFRPRSIASILPGEDKDEEEEEQGEEFAAAVGKVGGDDMAVDNCTIDGGGGCDGLDSSSFIHTHRAMHTAKLSSALQADVLQWRKQQFSLSDPPPSPPSSSFSGPKTMARLCPPQISSSSSSSSSYRSPGPASVRSLVPCNDTEGSIVAPRSSSGTTSRGIGGVNSFSFSPSLPPSLPPSHSSFLPPFLASADRRRCKQDRGKLSSPKVTDDEEGERDRERESSEVFFAYFCLARPSPHFPRRFFFPAHDDNVVRTFTNWARPTGGRTCSARGHRRFHK